MRFLEGVTALDSIEKALAAARAASDKKAHQIVLLDMRKRSVLTDVFVICHGESSTQMQAIADHISRRLREMRVRPHHIEGEAGNAIWILMDYGDIVVHIFNRESRDYYGLEQLWLDAERIKFEDDTPDLGRQVKRSLHS